MVKCPKCGFDNTKPEKEWDYAVFHVKKFNCQKCEAKYRYYTRDGKPSFILMAKFGQYQKP